MSLPEATQRRLPQIKAGLLEGKTSQEIATICHVRRETIERDKRSWRQSGELEDWVKEEAIRLHYLVVKKHPVDAYREVMRLLGKTLVQRIEAREQIDIRQIIVKMWKPTLEEEVRE
jgi:hypothetical protein